MRFYFFLVIVSLVLWGVFAGATCYPEDEMSTEGRRDNARFSLVALAVIVVFWLVVGLLLLIGMPGLGILGVLLLGVAGTFIYKIIKIARS